MRLISLELNGFKSFAQKTKIEFMPGMTGIVGPNGSGKSNIIEAIRWVMGEQSAKDLRGSKMTDVIFAGSDTRKPVNRAEVSITFDNQDHYLSSDYTEIKITRKLYRNGDSEYLLNGQECRLKDVLDLFMDSGLGRESFSIISQGRVEAIFNGKSTDRRAVIEEVAGVAKYKKNKTTAEKRLSDTTDNLHRVSDIISELETQLEPLAQQSSLAREYKDQKSQFDLLDRTKTVLNIEQYQRQKESIEKQQQSAKKMASQYEIQTAEANKKIDQLKQIQTELTNKKDQLQSALLTQTKQLADVKNTLNLTNERSSQQDSNLSQMKSRRDELVDQKTTVENQLRNVETQITEQLTSIKSAKEELDQLSSMSAQQQADALNQKIEKLQGQQVDQMQALTTVHNQKSYLTRNHEQSVKRQEEVGKQQATIKTRLSKLNQELTSKQESYGTESSKLDDLKQQLNGELSQQQKLKYGYDKVQKAWYQSLATVQSLEARINSLKSMETEYTGFYQGVRQVLQHRQMFQGLFGPVSELINVPIKFTTAVETVLGAQLQNLVVDNQSTGKQIIKYLVSKRAGRATILPIDTLANYSTNRSILSRVESLPGFQGLASDIVSIENDKQVVLTHLLGNTIIADQLDNATAIARQTQHRFRIVTLDGQLINASGSMTGGANRQQRQGILSRQQEIEQLDNDLSSAKASSTQLEERVQKYEDASKTNSVTIDDLRHSVAETNEQFQEVNGSVKLLTDQCNEAKRQLSALEYEINQDGDPHKSFDQQIADNDNQEKEIKDKIENIKQQITEAKNDLSTVQSTSSKRTQQLNDKKQWIAVAQEKVSHVKDERQQLNEQLNDINNELDSIKRQTDIANQSIEERQSERENAETQLKNLTEQQSETQSNLSQIDQQLTSQASKLEEANVNADRLRELQQASLNELNDVNSQNMILESKIDQGLNRLSENYSMTFIEAKQNLSDKSLNEISSQLKLLKRGLDEIGPVNLGSIEEYERVNKRYSFLHDQQTDLLDAKKQLSDTMQEMDEEVKTRFNESFHQIATSFSHVFVQMFGGGQAKLVLTDPDDLLTTGVDIIAQPPGKKNQHMSLLSGGEKALTAITLLFAILEVRPVPFAILDETEAALDEANVNRFARYLSMYGSRGPQFIVVTHRKGTMMNANVLYGVTMQESGVSKMVSVSLEDVPV